ncbi:uncharacterized protein LOC143913363 [Arctopsyche grandis]|uniref:uncharacterized protein LOC143913363 n=1 Tax=Arctopsyche grandis TaxID=121162 RepID=UPI00406D9C9A
MASLASIDAYLSSTIGDTEKLALFLDYDGTLSPISSHPDLAVMPPETKTLLTRLANCSKIYTAIISGRQADNAKSVVGIDNITYAGSHGFEIVYPDSTRYKYETPLQDKEEISNIIQALNNEVVRDGAWIESKGDVFTYHYRDTPAEIRDQLVEQARSIITRLGLTPTNAIYGLEVQPEIDWHKGHAAKYLLENKFGRDWNNSVKLIYIGDDTTDENLMEMFRGRATTFRVAASKTVKTAAGLRLASLDDVVDVLKWLEKKFC